MKAETLKKVIKKKLIKYLLIIGVLTAAFVGSYSYDSMSSSTFNDIQAKVSAIQTKIVKINKDYQESEAQLKEYLAIDKLRLPTADGYALGRDRLRIALPEVKELKDIYMFKKLNFSLSEVEMDKSIDTKSFKGYKNKISIDFAGVSDEYVTSFVNDIKNKLPGYITINALSINREEDINMATIKSYLSTGEGKPFVTGKLELEWVTLKTEQASDKKPPIMNIK